MEKLARRSCWGHKGDYGLTLVIGGSRGMCGAVALASQAALISGAGLVRVAVPDSILNTVAAFAPEIMTVALKEDVRGRISLDALTQIASLSQSAQVVILGPGLGRSIGLTALVARLYREMTVPMIVDADALNALAEYGMERFKRMNGPRILTPHPGEFSRLTHCPLLSEKTEEERFARLNAAQTFARDTNTLVVLKGHQSVITDGKKLAVNQTGNPGMGTGGSGDVLTGVIGGLISQKMEIFAATVLGTHLHGLAGDLAVQEFGEQSLTARSILTYLPRAIQQDGIE
ncbi:MAG: NAD(P)H-hydrate dehydratase [Thermoguttaceae bacterium]